jgi:hypothetical protein
LIDVNPTVGVEITEFDSVVLLCGDSAIIPTNAMDGGAVGSNDELDALFQSEAITP